MSYDLYFTTPQISREDFRAYFQKRPGYELHGNQAIYQSKDTGVYFSFEYAEPKPDDREGIKHVAMFNINYYRPHYFILEAEPEVSKLVKHFGFGVHDPQMHGMGDGPYTAQGLLSGWNHGNEVGYEAVLAQPKAPASVHSRSGEELEKIWRWNFGRKEYLQELGKDIFIPRIMFAVVGGELSSLCVWPDAISTLIPKVDRLWIPREQLAPKPDSCLIKFSEALPLLQPYKVSKYALEAYELPSPATPAAIQSFVSGLKPIVGKPTGVSMDQVMDRELVEKYRKQP